MTDRSYRAAAKILCGIVVGTGLLVLVGWAMHWPVLVRFHSTWASMKPNTALGLVLAAVSLLVKLKPKRSRADEWLSAALGASVCLLGVASLIEHGFGVQLGIDDLLLKDDLTKAPTIPGQLSGATAKSFVFLGSGLLAFDWTARRPFYMGQLSAFMVFLFSLVSITGYVYDVNSLYKWKSFETTAIHTSLSLLSLSVAMLLTRPRLGVMAFLTSIGPGSALARRVVLPAILLPFVMGWFRVSAEKAGLFSIRFGSGLAMLCSVLVLVGLILWNAQKLDRLDVSRLKAEALLRRKDKELFQASKLEAVGRLAGGVAHDFNNILTGVIGLVEEVRSETPEGHPHRHLLRSVIQSADRAAQLTKQLLGFSRQQVAAPVVLDLNEVIRSLNALLSRSLGPDIELLEILSREPAFVVADPTQLEQILLNLSLNAKDAMPAGGQLTFKTSLGLQEGVAVVVWEILDSGVGMSPETLKNIFEPFFTTKEIGRGTGLGLATVYGIIKQNKGDVTVQSDEGRGTVFRIVWPATQARPLSPAAIKATCCHEEKNKTVLVVDDEELVLRFVVNTLRKAGYSVLSATNASEALALGQDRRTPISLLLTDVIMPQMNGADLSEHLRAARPDLRVLFMSGYSEKVIVDRGILKTGIHFIEKAFTAEKLQQRVQDVLHEKSV